MIRFSVALIALLGTSACQQDAPGRMTLAFGTYASSPVVLTQLGIERPRGGIGQPSLEYSRADLEYPRTTGGALIGAPRDAGEDGLWRIEAQWVELMTGKGWEAEVDVPVDQLVRFGTTIELGIIFGPHGLMEVDSDYPEPKPVSEVNTIGRTCGRRAPDADEDWLNKGFFTGKQDYAVANVRPVPTQTHCPAPRE